MAREGQTLPIHPARRIAFDVDEGTMLSLDVSPDGGSIVFDLLGDLYLLPAVGGRAKPLTHGMAVDAQPVFSPDGKQVLFLSDRSGAENLWVLDVASGKAAQLSFYDDDPIFVSPAWSADGAKIFVSRFWSDRNAYEILRFAARGDVLGSVLVGTGGAEARRSGLGAAPSPDGTSLYYAEHAGKLDFDAPDHWRIVRRDLRSGETRAITPASAASAFRPAISADGAWLAYAQRRDGRTFLRVQQLAIGAERELAELDPDSTQASAWSDLVPRFDFAPGDALVATVSGKIVRFDLKTGAGRPIPFQAKVDQQLAPLARTPIREETGPVVARLIQTPEASPDGSRLAFSALGQIYLMPLDGRSRPRRLTHAPTPEFHPSWSPDGSQLTFVTWTAEGGGDVWIAPADAASPPRRAGAEPGWFYTRPIFTPDGAGLIYLRSSNRARLETYLEFGPMREAELVYLPQSGAPARVLARGPMGGRPHFAKDPREVLIDRPDGVHAISLADGRERLVVQVVGPNWYFAEGSAQADDIRISPDGRYGLAQIAQQAHLFQLPAAGGTIDLSASNRAHARITDIGADFIGWAEGGRALTWSTGASFFRLPLSDAPFASSARPQRFDARVEVPRDRPKGAVILRGATLVTMDGHAGDGKAGAGRVLKDADIVIAGDRIQAIGPRGATRAPAGADIIDVSGAYIVPGLIDSHDHVADVRRDLLDMHPWGPATALAYGVTTRFDPSSLTIDMLAYEDLIDSGRVLGARLHSTGPAIFAFNDFRTREQVRAVLRRYRDFYRTRNIKQYRSGNRRVRQWVAEEARALGLTVTTEGALAYKLDLSHMLDGFSGNEHAIPPLVHHRDLTTLLARSGTSNGLTLQITYGGVPARFAFIRRDRPTEDPKFRRFTPQFYRQSRLTLPPELAEGDFLYPKAAASGATLLRAGGLLALGSHGDVPGLGAHWEMEAYAAGGMSPAEILWTATVGSARAIGRDLDLGSIASGKLADLVVLDRNPLEDIKNTRAIRYVMRGGRLYEAQTLDEIWPDRRSMEPFWFSPKEPKN